MYIHQKSNWVDFFFAYHEGDIIFANPYSYGKLVEAHDCWADFLALELWHLPVGFEGLKGQHVVVDLCEALVQARVHMDFTFVWHER